MTRWVFNEDGWTDWHQHDGKGCPCVGWWAEVEFKDGDTKMGVATHNPCWSALSSDLFYYSIIRYRVRKPKGAEILEQLVQDVLEPVDA